MNLVNEVIIDQTIFLIPLRESILMIIKKQNVLTIIVLLFLISPVVLTADLNASGIPDSRDQKKWTFMVYLDADSNLDPYGHDDLAEMKAVGSDSDINIIVLWDGAPNNDGALYYVTQGDVDEFPVSDAGIPNEPDMSNPSTLDSFLQWGLTNYPADHYLLSLWNHGNGIFRNNEEPVTKGFCGGMKIWELNQVLGNAKTTAGKNIDIVGFDACLMGAIETHYQMAPFVDFGIASEATEPGPGWDYETPLEALSNNPNMSPSNFATEIVNSYVDYYNSGTITQAAIDLNRLVSHFMPLLENVTVDLINYMYYHESAIQTARSNAQTFNGYTNMRDLYDFVRNLQQTGSLPAVLRNDASALLNEFPNTVIAEGNKGVTEAHGMVIYFPTDGPSSTYQNNIDMAAGSMWDEFLEEYVNPKEHYDVVVELYDDDGDGHNDDVKITIQNFVAEPASGSEVWVDQVSIGTTDGNGVILHLDSPKGMHQVRARVGNLDIYGQFKVINRVPAAGAIIPDAIDAGQSIVFDSSLSSDPDGDTLSYEWTFGDGGGSPLANPEHVFQDDGVFTVTLVVIDTDSAESDPFTFDMTVNNLAPVADAGTAPTGNEDEVIYFDGSASEDTPQDKANLEYRWDFGDGLSTAWLSFSYVNHTFTNDDVSNSSKTYNVVLSVRDDDGEISTDTLEVVIDNVVPVADAGMDFTLYEDEIAFFDGRNSSDSISDQASLVFDWDFDDSDGLDYTDAEGAEVSHVFHTSGNQKVMLRVTDDNGDFSTDAVHVNVVNRNPEAVVTEEYMDVNEGEILLLDGSLSEDTPSDLQLLEYEWSLDNGMFWYGEEVNLTLNTSGVYNATLTVKDDDGASDFTTFRINVSNLVPMAFLTVDQNQIYEDSTFILNASRTTDTPNDLPNLMYHWDLNHKDGVQFSAEKTTNTPFLEYIYTSSGTKEIILKVVDDNGAWDTTELIISVENIKPEANLTLITENIVEEKSALFDAKNSTDTESDAPSLIYRWYVNGELVDEGNSTLTYVFKDPGVQTVRLEVIDDDGGKDEAMMSVDVAKKESEGIGNMLISPTFANGGLWLYFVIIILVAILLIAVLVARKRKNKREPKSTKPDKKGSKKSELRKKTPEEKKSEYDKLYGPPSSSASTLKRGTENNYYQDEYGNEDISNEFFEPGSTETQDDIDFFDDGDVIMEFDDEPSDYQGTDFDQGKDDDGISWSSFTETDMDDDSTSEKDDFAKVFDDWDL